MAKQWPMLPDEGFSELFAADKLKPDFQGEGIKWIHRRNSDADIYFLANSKRQLVKQECTFRITGKIPELWNPETGEAFDLSDVRQVDGRTTVTLQFEPWQSWFVIFRDNPTVAHSKSNPFVSWKTVQDITGSWSVNFDPDWGSKETLNIDTLSSWSQHPDPLVKYYSGTAAYNRIFEFSKPEMLNARSRYCLDLGKVEVMARVIVNGKDCGIAWKPPYRIDITEALRAGKNKLKIEVVNTWVNRLVGDEHLELDAIWEDNSTFVNWPDWFKQGRPSPTGRYTFTAVRHYKKESPLMPSGLLGPVRILSD